VAKASEVVNQGVQAIQAKLKEIKQADEEDLAQSFDDLSSQADELAGVLFRADQALTGQNDDDEQADQDDEPEADEESEAA